MGLLILIKPSLRSASSSPTIWYVTFSPDVSSSNSTVAPKTTLPPASTSEGSITWAADSLPSISWIRPSIKPWRSLAASYSAFSLKSPWARASAIALITEGRSMVLSLCNSSLSFSAPRLVIGIVAINFFLMRSVAHACLGQRSPLNCPCTSFPRQPPQHQRWS